MRVVKARGPFLPCLKAGAFWPQKGKRTLQRLFSRHVGVSPKWVIKRYRLHEVAARLEAGASLDWLRLVVELGYSDQTHLIKDFKAIVGKTPTEYARGRATTEDN